MATFSRSDGLAGSTICAFKPIRRTCANSRPRVLARRDGVHLQGLVIAIDHPLYWRERQKFGRVFLKRRFGLEAGQHQPQHQAPASGTRQGPEKPKGHPICQVEPVAPPRRS